MDMFAIRDPIPMCSPSDSACTRATSSQASEKTREVPYAIALPRGPRGRFNSPTKHRCAIERPSGADDIGRKLWRAKKK